MTEDQLQAALRLQEDGAEIGSIVLANITAAAEREGRELSRSDACGNAATVLLAASWSMAKRATDDEAYARLAFVELLRGFADRVERLVG